MKGFTRYYRDGAFKADVDEQFALAAAATRPGLWITYAIHDPTQLDYIENRPEGLIRYVGQSKQFATRVRDRMTTAGRAVKQPTDKIDDLLYDIMRRGPAPRWTVLDEVRSAIESLVSRRIGPSDFAPRVIRLSISGTSIGSVRWTSTGTAWTPSACGRSQLQTRLAPISMWSSAIYKWRGDAS